MRPGSLVLDIHPATRDRMGSGAIIQLRSECGWCLPSLRATSSQPPSFQVRSVGQAVSVLRQRPHPGCFVIGQSSAFVGRGFPGAFAFTASHPVPPALHLICFAL